MCLADTLIAALRLAAVVGTSWGFCVQGCSLEHCSYQTDTNTTAEADTSTASGDTQLAEQQQHRHKVGHTADRPRQHMDKLTRHTCIYFSRLKYPTTNLLFWERDHKICFAKKCKQIHSWQVRVGTFRVHGEQNNTAKGLSRLNLAGHLERQLHRNQLVGIACTHQYPIFCVNFQWAAGHTGGGGVGGRGGTQKRGDGEQTSTPTKRTHACYLCISAQDFVNLNMNIVLLHMRCQLMLQSYFNRGMQDPTNFRGQGNRLVPLSTHLSGLDKQRHSLLVCMQSA